MLAAPSRRMFLLSLFVVSHLAVQAQHIEKPLFSFQGYYESVMGTVSYFESEVSWSYLYEKDTENVRGLRLFVPQEGFSTDFLITELWGNDEAVMFICEETAILLMKDSSPSAPGPIISISKVSELDMPRKERSYCRYFALEDFSQERTQQVRY